MLQLSNSLQFTFMILLHFTDVKIEQCLHNKSSSYLHRKLPIKYNMNLNAGWQCLTLLDLSQRTGSRKSQLMSMMALKSLWWDVRRWVLSLCDVYWLGRWLLMMGLKYMEYTSRIRIPNNNEMIIWYELNNDYTVDAELKIAEQSIWTECWLNKANKT